MANMAFSFVYSTCMVFIFSASCLCTDCFYLLSSFLSFYTVNYVSSMIIQVKPVD